MSGKVADGYVSNASVTIYSDAALTNQIGSGTTDASGNFSITLSVSTVPDTVYIKTVGGTDLDTGMPAPTMLFVGSGSNSTFNITPFTDSIYKYSLSKGGVSNAVTYLTGQLGITSSELYDDPVANSTLAGALYNTLASGTQGGTLPDGSYSGVVIAISEDDFGTSYSGITDIETNNTIGMNITVSGGVVNGTVSGTGDVVTGMVQGSSVILNVIGSSSITRVTGNIGLLGSVAGVFTSLDTTTGSLSKGVYAASFIPASGLDPTGVATVVGNLYTGPRHAIIRDVLGDSNRLRWGDITINSIDISTGTVTASDTLMTEDAGSTVTSPPFLLAFVTGKFLKISGLPANIVILRYNVGTTDVYAVQPVGGRRGIYLAVNTATTFPEGVGEFYMSKTQSLAPSLDSLTSYGATIAVAHPGLLGQTRDTSQMLFTDIFTTPDISNGTLYDTSGGELKVFNGSMTAFKDDDDDGGGITGLNDLGIDYVRILELYETGAFQGEEMVGGCTTVSGALGNCDGVTYTIPLKKFPATFVGLLKKPTDAAPSFTGTLNFLARTLYSVDYTNYANAYVTGTISISGTSATLNWADATGSSGTASLAASNSGGVYHLYGALGTEYIDIYWPVGGTKATYIISASTDGTGLVGEVGEAFLTY